MTRTSAKQRKFLKRYLKTLELSQGYPNQLKELLRQAPVPVLKLLSNATIIASRGSVQLTPKQKKIFRKHKKLFNILSDRSIGFNRKRRFLVQRGGFAQIIPILLSAILPVVGELLFNLIGKQ